MKLITSAFVVLALSGVASADMTTSTDTTSTMKTENCGEMMKSLMPLPTKFEELMTAVSEGFESHAKWMEMSKDKNAKAEAKVLTKLAKDHRAVAKQMAKIMKDLEEGSKLQPAPHDMAKADPKWSDLMMKRAKLEREMAALMVQDADQTDKMLNDMKAAHAAK